MFALPAPRDKFGIPDFCSPHRPDYCRQHPMVLDDSLHFYDCLKLSSSLEYDLEGQSIAGWAGLSMISDEIPLSRIDLRFGHTLLIDSISAGVHSVDSVTRHGEDSLQVYVSPEMAVGDTVDLTVYYHGAPTPVDQWGGMFFNAASGSRPEICYTMGDGLNLEEPPANHAWLPCFNDPGDKVLSEFWMRVPTNRVAVGPGLRLETVDNGDNTHTWHYRLDQPVSTYLLFASVSDYQIMTQRESGPVIENFVYPAYWNAAQVHFLPVPQCLDSFAANFGPFVFDRFGYNMARNGDMEHVTSVTHYDGAVVNNRGWDWLLFHEMSHHWWGDWVTCADWRDLWLNEGFASYCEALGMEWVRGEADFRAYVKNDLQPAARNPQGTGTIYDPDYYWGTIVYEKGACVMHMLRFVMGDSHFFAALRDYGQQFAFSAATTVEFQAVCESHYDSTLQWFFDQWVFEGVNYPRFDVTYTTSDVPILAVNQIQSTNFFTMPLEIACYIGDAIIVDTVWVIPDANGDWFTQEIGLFDSVKIDPNGWILKIATHHNFSGASEHSPLPKSFDVTSTYPNPFNPTVNVTFESPISQEVTMSAFDVQGRVVHKEQFVATPGSNIHSWNAADKPSGIYWIQLSTLNETRTAKAVLIK